MDLATIDATSEQYLGQWKRLVSTTNWEKGHIISQWRRELAESGAPASEYADEAWSRRVGNVTPQHVGRLRRVFEQFAEARDSYLGLYWSHYQAALDWDDAPLWLEGAVQNGWSISEMRRTRWEATGAVAEEEPRSDDASLAEWDDDAEPDDKAEIVSGSQAEVRAPRDSAGGRDAVETDEDAGFDHEQFDAAGPDGALGTPADKPGPIAPFALLPSLPADVADAVESFKLAILRHKLAGWQEITLTDTLVALDALKALATAP